MKNIALLMMLLGLCSCGREAKDVTAPTQPIQLSEEGTKEQVEKFGPFESNPALASLFMWPQGETLERVLRQESLNDITAVASVVGEYSTKIDQLYRQLAKDKKELNESMDKKEELRKVYRERYNQEKDQIVKSYGCYLDEATRKTCTNLTTGNPELFKYPMECKKLKDSPWKKKPMDIKICSQKVDDAYELHVKKNFEEENKDLFARIDELRKQIDNQTDITIPEYSDKIASTIDPESDDPKKTTWIGVDYKKCVIEHADDKTPPALTLYLRFNNLQNNFKNEHLIYKSAPTLPGEQAAIVNTELVIEKETPSLKFRILEKRMIPEDQRTDATKTEDFTGDYYDVVLRRSLQDFGLLYLGKVKKFNGANQMVAEGMMKIVIQEKSDVTSETESLNKSKIK